MDSLKAETVVLTSHGMKDNIKSPNMPEVTVRLLINYNKCHKTVVRVSPQVPIERLLPVLCEKCDLRVKTTVLLRDDRSHEPLDINKTLNEHGLRELYAEGRTDKNQLVDQYQPSTNAAANVTPVQHLEDMPFKTKKQKENNNLLSLFRRLKKKADMGSAASNLKNPKRKAPPPPIVNTLQDLLVDTPDESQMSDR
ncbi:cordon-bleu protein-like 1 isoform X2 [Entelurus aequoreus]|uniref:cordon-bleu protein-like 1 isoform X2 n=1 Tax=Entelurus aequoreus TaxID=161455 RepID=UPI002B1D1217|nr:cordon-bleu protein-like 1 isoform X2 [Entelurus aequoreus]